MVYSSIATKIDGSRDAEVFLEESQMPFGENEDHTTPRDERTICTAEKLLQIVLDHSGREVMERYDNKRRTSKGNWLLSYFIQYVISTLPDMNIDESVDSYENLRSRGKRCRIL
ncbi:MAG TPA: hypothetical protein VN426_13675 [Syntrophomonadaceae bacterium]|nr:hypothetical protein [Syntrophomonadaceae bacterium]